MKALTIFALALIGLLIGATAMALVMEQYLMPQTAYVSAAAFYLDDVQWTNNTLVDWGSVEPDNTYLWSFRVNNTSAEPINVTLYVSGLPVGWLETWSMNYTTIAVGESAVAPLELYIPVGATGFASWSMWIEISDP